MLKFKAFAMIARALIYCHGRYKTYKPLKLQRIL